jgi:hypothetical protein
VTASLIEHARASLIYERIRRKELEALRGDVRTINQFPQPRSAVPPQGSSTIISPTGQSQSRSPVASHQHSPSSSVHTTHLNKEQPARSTIITQNQNGSGSPANGALGHTSNRPQSPLRNPSNAGRPLDGSQSMFVSPSRPSATSSPRGGGVVDPLSASVHPTRPNFGPNGNVRDAQMGRSMFIEPVRGKIDQREAARKLANFL